jgi:hypothetical protein
MSGCFLYPAKCKGYCIFTFGMFASGEGEGVVVEVRIEEWKSPLSFPIHHFLLSF